MISDNVLAVYKKFGSTVIWQEQYLYGSSRLGSIAPGVSWTSAPAATPHFRANRTLRHGWHRYELTDHLGNVRAALNGRRTIYNPTDTAQLYYTAAIAGGADYFPFGAEMRTSTAAGAQRNRYGFNGKELDKNGEFGVMNHYDYGFRVYNPGIGRFLGVDPLTSKYPSWTPYAFAMNRPIDGVDLDGLEYLDSDKNHVEIVSGKIKLKVENFNPNSRKNWEIANSNPSNWNINCPNPNGCIGISRDITTFRIEFLSSPAIPGDLKPGISLDNSLDPFVDPTSTYNPAKQEIIGERKPLRIDGGYDQRYKSVGESQFLAGNIGKIKTVGKISLIYDIVQLTYEQYQMWATNSTQKTINEHKALAIEALNDTKVAFNSNLVPAGYRDEHNFSLVANYLLNGETKGMSRRLVEIAKNIWQKVSIPTITTQESGLDNFKPASSNTNPYKKFKNEK